MFRRIAILAGLVAAVLLAVLASSCGEMGDEQVETRSGGQEELAEAQLRGQVEQAAAHPSQGSTEELASAACQGVGVVTRASDGARGAPIVLLEERHDSRAGQIQHAITLVRLHDQRGLRHIALEGYLRERAEIVTDWYFSAARGHDSPTGRRVAVQLLKEGEISCAEFMALVYRDVSLHAIETESEYDQELDDEASAALTAYLLGIAQASLREEHVPALERFQKDIERIEAQGDTLELVAKYKEFLEYILTADPWVRDKYLTLKDLGSTRSISGEEHIALLVEIVDRAESLSVDIEPDQKRAMDRCLSFWRGRVAASRTMTISAGGIADRSDVSMVAMVVGAAHTEGMCALLAEAGRPHVVVTPLALQRLDEGSDLTFNMLTRKYAKLSVYAGGITDVLLDAFPSLSNKKPEPVLSEPWFQAKAELYLFTERIADDILGPPEPPGGGEPPFALSADAFRGKWLHVDPMELRMLSDDEGRAVLFPAILNPDDPSRRRELWVKAALGEARVSREERESVESMLQKALEEVEREGEPSSVLENEGGRVQITSRTIAAIAATQQDAQRALLRKI